MLPAFSWEKYRDPLSVVCPSVCLSLYLFRSRSAQVENDQTAMSWSKIEDLFESRIFIHQYHSVSDAKKSDEEKGTDDNVEKDEEAEKDEKEDDNEDGKVDEKDDEEEELEPELTEEEKHQRVCQSLIDTIRREEFGIGVELNEDGRRLMVVQQERLGRSLDRLSKDLYSKDTHFVLGERSLDWLIHVGLTYNVHVVGIGVSKL